MDRLTANRVSARTAVVDRGGLEHGDRLLALGRVDRHVALHAQDGAAAEPGRVLEREVGGLPPGRAAVDRADRGDDVDELGEAGHADAVGVAQQRDQAAADDQRVGHRVGVLDQRRRLHERLFAALELLGRGLVPDVPLVDAERDAAAAALAAGHRVGGGGHRLDHAVEVERGGEEGLVVREPRGVVVGVQRDVVGDVPREVEHRVLPRAERRHAGVGAAADDELERGIDEPHRLARLVGRLAVGDRVHVADLPRPVHLVADAPDAHAVRVAGAAVGPLGAARGVAVLDEMARGVEPARAHVDRQHRLHAGAARPR